MGTSVILVPERTAQSTSYLDRTLAIAISNKRLRLETGPKL